jgi:hypothetical protein
MTNKELIPDSEELKKKHYFINELVEWQLTKYIWTGTTSVEFRNEIMEHANELIIQLIRKQGLYNIYRGHDPSALNELVHVAYMQIERTLYKYRSQPHCRRCFSYERPNASILYEPAQFEFGIITPERLVQMHPKCLHCGQILKIGEYIEPSQGLYGGTYDILYRGMSKVFNMWSQVARTVILAYVKKDTRDVRNGDNYTEYISRKHSNGNNEQYVDALTQARNAMWFNSDYCAVVDALIELSSAADPDKNFKKKLCTLSGVEHKIVENALIVLQVMLELHAENFSVRELKCS